MFCTNCGNKLPEGASFCTACGSQQPSAAQPSNESATHETFYQNNMAPSSPVKPRKKHVVLRVLVALVLVILLLSGITVLGYYTFLPAKYTLMVAEYFSFNENFEAFDRNMAEFYEKRYKPVLENSFATETEFGISIEDSILEAFGIPSDTLEIVSGALKNITLSYGQATDIKNKVQTASLGVNFMKNPFVTAEFFLDDTRFGLSVPQLTGKTLIGDLRNLDNLANLSSDFDETTIEILESTDPWISARLYDEIKIDRQDIKKLLFDYSNEFINSIDQKDMSIKRGVETEVIGKDMSCQEVTIKLDPKAQKKIAKNILKKMRKDDNLYNLTLGNMEKAIEILFENEYYKRMFTSLNVPMDFSQDSFEDNIDELIEILDEADEDDFIKNITIKIYIKGLGSVKHVVEFAGQSKNENVVFTMESIGKDLSYDKKLSIRGGTKDNGAEISILLKKNHDKKSNTTDNKVDVNLTINDFDTNGNIIFSLESNEDPDGKNTVKHNVNVSLKVDITNYDEPITADAQLTIKGTKALNSKGLVTESDYKGEITVNNVPYIESPISIGFFTKTENTYGEKIDIPDADDPLDLATATNEDFYVLMDEIYEKLGAFGMMLYGF